MRRTPAVLAGRCTRWLASSVEKCRGGDSEHHPANARNATNVWENYKGSKPVVHAGIHQVDGRGEGHGRADERPRVERSRSEFSESLLDNV